MAITPQRYATNDTDQRETTENIETMNISTTAINTKVGEVQASPTSNTVLDRLKTISANTLDHNQTIVNDILNQVYVRNTTFKVILEITRPANTTGYSNGDIINNAGSSVLPEIDFSYLGNMANRTIEITRISILDSKPTNITTPDIHFFNANTIIGSTLTDNLAFNPSFSELCIKREATIPQLPTLIKIGSNGHLTVNNSIEVDIKLDANGKTYIALILNENFTPISGENFCITINGHVH